MRARCSNLKSPDYKNYGGRGIRVCERWCLPEGQGFRNFIDDMGEPLPNMTIERVDVNGDYSPDNCTWITNEAQANNRRTTHYLTLDGVTMNIMQWSKYAGVDRGMIYDRLNKPGLSMRQIIFGIKNTPT